MLGSLGHQSLVAYDGNRSSVTADLPAGGLIHPRCTVDGEHVGDEASELFGSLRDAIGRMLDGQVTFREVRGYADGDTMSYVLLPTDERTQPKQEARPVPRGLFR